MVQTDSSEDIIAVGDLGVNIASFRRHIRAENLSPRTQETYTKALDSLVIMITLKDLMCCVYLRLVIRRPEETEVLNSEQLQRLVPTD